MIMGTTKRCHKCRQSYAAGDANEWPFTCKDCRIETFHVLTVLAQEADDVKVGSVCGTYLDWPHTWPKDQGYVVTPQAADPKRLCRRCAELYVAPVYIEPEP